MRLAGYIALFVVIQAVSLVLAILGLPICAFLAFRGKFNTGNNFDDTQHIQSFPTWAWLWSNDEDGVYPFWYAKINPTWSVGRTVFVWTALRNPVNNLRFVPGVSKKGRPFWRKTWGSKPGGWYVQAGWNGSGWPVISVGRNVNPY